MTAATQPVTVEDAGALAGLTYAWEVESAPDPSPMAGPSWLRASDGIDPRMPPYRYLLARPGNGHLAALPLHVVRAATTPDADPRSYFGGTMEATAGLVGAGSQQASPAAEVLAGLDAADVFPALVLGSLPGYKTEILHSYWTPALAADLLDAAVDYARTQGIATIVAPFVADRGSGKALGRELRRRGAVASFWATEDYLPLRHGSLAAHVAAMRHRDRYRYREDTGAAATLGLDVRTLTTAELREHLSRIGTLEAATRRRYGQDVADDEAPQILARLLELLAEHGDSAESRIPVAIETPRGLLTACLRTSRPVYAINPMAVARYRDRHSVAGRQSDHGDAVVLASVLRTDIITAGTPAECKTAIEALTAEIRITQEGIVPVFKIPPPGTLTPGSHTDDLTVNPVRATVHPVGRAGLEPEPTD